ncbi:MAG: fumarylacetoacetate hydrolase family protein [Anaerolineales bacterium]|nr:fumarylacetoacetate hydrolase family protein [Anaerolineales bacterium]MCB0007289.1 fumarylacetoacetate hydrolase family protein [Anaerolineales bacterium]MCB0020412.1 fumarylacetoacetate hydrolase family protein [Anaerolineales bacterium]
MKLVSYLHHNTATVGILVDGQLHDLNRIHRARMGDTAAALLTMESLLNMGDAGMALAATSLDFSQVNGMVTVPENEITYLPPVTRPSKILALGRNYAAHAAEGGSAPPDYPMFFHKTMTSLSGHQQTILIPEVCHNVDFEAELAVIIGKSCRNVSEADALEYVAGYTVANDVTDRAWQRRTSQFTIGKMIDGFGPLGPALVTRDEVPDVQALGIRGFLNGELMQESNTNMMLFSVAFTIHYVSQVVTLLPGDVILTGTPEGVGFARKPPVWLKDGDEFTVEVDGVGRLTNHFAAA